MTSASSFRAHGQDKGQGRLLHLTICAILIFALTLTALTPLHIGAESGELRWTIDSYRSNGVIGIEVLRGTLPDLQVRISNTANLMPEWTSWFGLGEGLWQTISYQTSGQIQVPEIGFYGLWNTLPPDTNVVYGISAEGPGKVAFTSDMTGLKIAVLFALQNLMRLAPPGVGPILGKPGVLLQVYGLIYLTDWFRQLGETMNRLLIAKGWLEKSRHTWSFVTTFAQAFTTGDLLTNMASAIWDACKDDLLARGYASAGDLLNLFRSVFKVYAVTQVLLQCTQVFAYQLAGIWGGSIVLEVYEAPITPVNPHVSISSATGVAGTSFAVQWTGFSKSGELIQHLQPKGKTTLPVVVVTTDDQGRATSAVQSDPLPPGTYELSGTDCRTGAVSNKVEFVVTGDVDLSASSVTFLPASVLPGDELSVTFTIRNGGSASSGPFLTWICASTATYGTENILAKVLCDSIGRGASDVTTISALLPPSFNPGQYYVTVYVDAPGNGVVQESREDNNSGSSSPKKIAIESPIPTPPAVPVPPTLNDVIGASNNILLGWTDNSNNEDGFKIERKEGTSGTYTQIGTTGANVYDYADSGLQFGKIYCYRVRAYNSAGNSGYSSEKCATTLSTPTLSSPANGVTVNTNTVTLTWNSVTGADGYAIKVSKTSCGGGDIFNGVSISCQQQISNLANGVYYWQVQAFATTYPGISEYSACRYFTVAYTPPTITLTLYVHENSASGPIIVGAQVTGYDGAGNYFSKITNSYGYVTITGVPGTWSFTASKSGYYTNSWSQGITSTCEKHAYLIKY